VLESCRGLDGGAMMRMGGGCDVATMRAWCRKERKAKE
jgi:hypothetical protein